MLLPLPRLKVAAWWNNDLGHLVELQVPFPVDWSRYEAVVDSCR